MQVLLVSAEDVGEYAVFFLEETLGAARCVVEVGARNFVKLARTGHGFDVFEAFHAKLAGLASGTARTAMVALHGDAKNRDAKDRVFCNINSLFQVFIAKKNLNF